MLKHNVESEIYISSPFVNCVCYKSLQVLSAFDIFYTTSVLERPWDENMKGSFSVPSTHFSFVNRMCFSPKE